MLWAGVLGAVQNGHARGTLPQSQALPFPPPTREVTRGAFTLPSRAGAGLTLTTTTHRQTQLVSVACAVAVSRGHQAAQGCSSCLSFLCNMEVRVGSSQGRRLPHSWAVSAGVRGWGRGLRTSAWQCCRGPAGGSWPAPDSSRTSPGPCGTPLGTSTPGRRAAPPVNDRARAVSGWHWGLGHGSEPWQARALQLVSEQRQGGVMPAQPGPNREAMTGRRGGWHGAVCCTQVSRERCDAPSQPYSQGPRA